MKQMMMDMKPDDEMQVTKPGEYTHEQMDEMLEHLVKAKEMMKDSSVMAMLKKHAMDKKMMMDEFLSSEEGSGKPKSISDLKSIAKKKAAMSSRDEE